MYEYNFWYNHSVLVAVWYAGQDGSSILTSIQQIGTMMQVMDSSAMIGPIYHML